MAKTILVAGYMKISYIQKIKSYFSGEEITLACAYGRQPKTEIKEKFLTHFDVLYNLTVETDIERLKNDASTIDCITCTQERDMVAYIQTLLLCNKITEDEAAQYHTVIDKHTFKESLRTSHPELVPEHNVVTEELLSKLDTLSYPQIIKPSGLAGGIMIRVVHSPEEFVEHHKRFSSQMQKIATEHYSKKIDIITESYIEGPQYSLNVYINADGEVTFCPLVRVVTPQELGIDDTYSVFQYTTDEITSTEKDSLEEAVKTIVNHFGIKNTSAHFDSVLHDGQWKFFEVGLRIGGNRQKQFEYSHGMNHFHNDIINRLGMKVVIPEKKKTSCILQKTATTSGVLKSISYTRKITSEKSPLVIESKLAKIGTDVAPLSLGGGTIARFFIVGKEFNEVMDSTRILFDSIQFEIAQKTH